MKLKNKKFQIFKESALFSNALIDLIFRAFKTRSLLLLTVMMSSVITYRYFSPESRGYLSLLVSLVAAVTAFGFNVEAHVQKEVGRRDNGSTSSIVFTAYVIRLLTCAFAVFSFLIIGLINFEIFGLTNLSHVFLISAVTLLSLTISPHNEVVVLGAQNFTAADRFYTLRFGALLLTLSFFLFLEMNIFYYFIILNCIQVFVFSTYSWFLTKKFLNGSKEILQNIASVKLPEILQFVYVSWPIWILTIFHTGSGTLAFICISLNLGFADVAGYALIFSLTSIVFTFPNRLEDYFYTYLSKLVSQDNKLFSKKYVQFQNIFSIMSAIPLTLWIVLAPALVPLVFGQDYFDFVYISYFMSIFFIMKSLNFVRRVFYIYDKSHNLMKIGLIKYIFEFLGYIFLTPLLGLNGVLISLILSQGLYTLLLFKNVQPFLTLSLKDIIRLSFICMFFIVNTLILYFCKLNNFDILFWVMIFANFCAYGGLLYTMKEKGYLDISASI